MPPPLGSASKPLPLLLCLAAVGLASSGCHAVRPEVGQARTLEAGVPESFGSASPKAPVVTWDFGDGTPHQSAAQVHHAFARAGTYTVRALSADTEAARVQLTVVPRPLLRAVPPDAQTVLWLPRLHGGVEPLVDFYERLVGAENARATLEEAPLVPLVLRSLVGGPSVVDPEEGLGFFLVPDFEGVVALLGVTETPAAMDAVSKELRGAGHQVLPQADGTVRVVPQDGGHAMLLFADRGYVYLAVPDAADTPPEGTPVQALADVPADLSTLRAKVERSPPAGMSESPLLSELRERVAPGDVFLFASPPKQVPEEAGTVRGFLGSLAVKATEMSLDGFLSTSAPLLEGERGPAAAVLSRSVLGPVAVAQLSVPPEELARLTFGAPGSARRERVLERWKAQGVDAEALLKALRGDVAMLVYFDAAAFYRDFIRARQPSPKGTVVMEAGLTSADPVLKLLTRQLEESGLRYDLQRLNDGMRFRTRLLEQPVELTVTSRAATLLAGETLAGQATGDVGARLRERFGAEAFGPGHLSLMVDVGRLREELQARREVAGVPQGQLIAAQAFVGALLDQLTPLDHGFLDFTPTEGGGRLKGRVVLREH
ncbi:PKD domain-containing protein [Myxococcaceae bacterium JPH2]|nr:PKD domain-containing protein [Myxococcaceae bacterium JPH2]